jgi:hypothetical protein
LQKNRPILRKGVGGEKSVCFVETKRENYRSNKKMNRESLSIFLIYDEDFEKSFFFWV